MSTDATLGVLSPFLGGWYFGGVLSGIAGTAAEAGAGVIAVQTLDAGTDHIEITEPSELGHPVAWRLASGFIVVLQAVTPRYLADLRAAGLPVVMVSQPIPGQDLPLVMPDNRTGIREAVAHLVAHGHRRIAFTGHLGTADVRERYDAYRAALRQHDLEPDPRLAYPTADNQTTGGAAAAQLMLADGLRSTAIVCATDENAAGLMDVFERAGLRLPDDQAVVGYDDIRSSSYLTPRLTSVRQPMDMIGKVAARTLLAIVDGQPPPEGRITVPTSLIVRESCGCAGEPHTQVVPDRPERLPDRIAELVTPVHGTLSAADTIILKRAAEVVSAAVEQPNPGCGADPPAPAHAEAVAELPEAAADLLRLGGRAEVLYEVAELLRCRGKGAIPALLALTQMRGSTLFHESAGLREHLSVQYEVGMDLLRGQREPARLEWLGRTGVRAGCLGLWTGGLPPTEADPVLEVASLFEAGRPPRTDAEPSLPVSEFPPPLLRRPRLLGEDLVTLVVPVKNGTSDWGWLAVVERVSTTGATGREPYNQWAALLTVALDRQALLRESLRQKEQLRIAALYDELTGLPNRSLFLDRLRQAMRQFRRPHGRPFGVLFLDLDGFKVVNDSMGHSAGDRLLKQVARRIKGALRETDTVARFGGDEFLVLLDEVAAPHTPAQVAERLHRVLAQPFQLHGQDVVVTASIGITMSSRRYLNAEDLLRDADIAMYSAKSAHKGRHAMFDTTMHDRAVSRMQIETELRQAIEGDEFEVHYQPIVLLRSGAVRSFEALIRWRHPVRGLLAPGEFMPVAEETGLVVPIGRWVIDECARRLATWRHEGTPAGLSVAVNVSNRQFWAGTVLDDVAGALDRHDLPPGSLAVEITEGVVMENVGPARDILDALHEVGCRLYIDDFGTGYSSLEALHRLPIDALKIDRSFVSRLSTDRRSGELVRTIVLMGRNLGLELIAEGIETPDERDRLVQLGCGYGQGFLFSRPVPPDDAYRLLTPAAAPASGRRT
ncbi:EAL domain-containing protein [Catellatospora sp. KI3]|uniref:EAL domain-containing protein n=1 Tax=Catellatospora sp. KI3 TaxID=3041620 RepID=UPI0024823308|nr:EAL domain-containing protein [Catellatospora sp. KI3]MDI1462360.1 EAL domain-containing protein [Catellatospora sp. KI3]